MKKGESGLTMLISIIVIIIILTQYFIFFVLFPHKTTQSAQNVDNSENELFLINFARANSDLIVKSVKTDNYKEVEEAIRKIKTKECFEIKINKEKFSNCHIENPEMSITTMPDYNNNQIKITLLTEKE